MDLIQSTNADALISLIYLEDMRIRIPACGVQKYSFKLLIDTSQYCHA